MAGMRLRFGNKKLFIVIFVLFIILSCVISVLANDSLFGKPGKYCDKDGCENETEQSTTEHQESVKVESVKSDQHSSDNSNTVNKKMTTDPSNTRIPDNVIKNEKGDDHVTHKQNIDPDPREINVIITFTNAKHNHNLHRQLAQTVRSMLELSSVPIALHIIGDPESQKIAADIVKENSNKVQSTYRFVNLDIDKLAQDLDDIVKPMQHHFSAKPGAYYHHALFFLSIAIHRVMPESMKQVIMLDADLKFKADIKELYDRFDLFTEDNVMGIGRDLQPVYRHAFWKYRGENPGTRVGEPPPDGLTGFNSGILLLNLENMRKSELYNKVINGESVKQLAEEFYFKGHLGDQDFFTLLSMKYEHLFHVLPCQWNRQLCRWWEGSYKAVFELYHSCDDPIKIYHGNCNTPIPSD